MTDNRKPAEFAFSIAMPVGVGIVLILMLCIILVTPVCHYSGISVAIPWAKNTTAVYKSQHPINITLQKEHSCNPGVRLYVGYRCTPWGDLPRQLKEHSGQNLILLKADRTIDFSNIKRVMACARDNGIKDVVLETAPGQFGYYPIFPQPKYPHEFFDR